MRGKIALVLAMLIVFLYSFGFLSGAYWQQQRAPELPVSEETLDYTILAMETAMDSHQDWARYVDLIGDYNAFSWMVRMEQEAEWAKIYDDVILVLEYVRKLTR